MGFSSKSYISLLYLASRCLDVGVLCFKTVFGAKLHAQRFC